MIDVCWHVGFPAFRHLCPDSDRRSQERLFAEITRQQIRRGAFKSVADLEAAIHAWIAAWNAKPTPFKWSAKAGEILEKNARAREVLACSHRGTQ